MNSESTIQSSFNNDTIYRNSANLALQIRNLSPKFSYQARNEMFYGLGATSVHNHPYFSVVFFSTVYQCQMVIRLLHQRKLQQKLLRVEYAQPEQIRRLPSHTICDMWLKKKIQQGQIEAFHKRQKQFSNDSVVPILHRKAETNFPKVSTAIINQIGQSMLNNERFYHSVLLLMMEFGLDVTFEKQNVDQLSSIPLPSSIESSESELETEPLSDLSQSKIPEFILRQKRKRKRLKTGLLNVEPNRAQSSLNKKPKISTMIEEVFEKNDNFNKTKKNSMKIKLDKRYNIDPKFEESNHSPFGIMSAQPPQPPNSSQPSNQQNNFDICLLTKQDLISDKDLIDNRIPRSEWKNYPIFNNYHPGMNASHRLYVKNIHRKVSLVDLYKLFAKYIDLDNDEHLNNFGIVYMEKGRMRGQAFVTYPEKSQACQAIDDTNGYCFHQSKPIIVYFARTCKSTLIED